MVIFRACLFGSLPETAPGFWFLPRIRQPLLHFALSEIQPHALRNEAPQLLRCGHDHAAFAEGDVAERLAARAGVLRFAVVLPQNLQAAPRGPEDEIVAQEATAMRGAIAI